MSVRRPLADDFQSGLTIFIKIRVLSAWQADDFPRNKYCQLESCRDKKTRNVLLVIMQVYKCKIKTSR